MEPLGIRFQRVFRLDRTDQEMMPRYELKPVYGKSNYITVCGRFRIYRIRLVGWRIAGTRDEWSSWLTAVGLSNAGFPTRKEALETLGGALDGDRLRDADAP